MKYMVRRFYSGYCTYTVEAENGDKAYELSQKLPINDDEILETLEEWSDCDEVEPIEEDDTTT